jgi:hypothetical protein
MQPTRWPVAGLKRKNMNLRSMLCVAVAVGGLMGCGQEQKYYRVAVDLSPLRNLPASCYNSGTTPAPTTITTQDTQQWILWDGVEDRKYLEVGGVNYTLGSASVSISGDALVSTGEGDKTTFVAERTLVDPNRTQRATYTFDNEGGLFAGDVIEGSISLVSTCAASGTNTCNQPANCEATLRFSGRRIDAEPMLLVNSGGGAN